MSQQWAKTAPEESKEPHQQDKSLRGQERKTRQKQDAALQNLQWPLMMRNSDIGKRNFSDKKGLSWSEDCEYLLFNEWESNL